MVSIGSGGSAGTPSQIIDGLPLARGLQFIQCFWLLRGVETVPLLSSTATVDTMML